MFEVFCPAHGTQVLLGTSRIDAVHNTPDGVVVAWHCWCGHHGRSIDGRTIADERSIVDGTDGRLLTEAS
jgi:hypothetical protein